MGKGMVAQTVTARAMTGAVFMGVATATAIGIAVEMLT